MRRRGSDPSKGGRALKDPTKKKEKKKDVDDIGVYCLEGTDEGCAGSSYTRAKRLTSRDARWRVLVEGMGTSEK
eukprot:13910084-Alexandrium_andersonii.AAC.1